MFKREKKKGLKPMIWSIYYTFKKPNKDEQIKLKTTRRKEPIKIWAEINEIELRKTIENPKLVLKVSKFDKPLARLITKRRYQYWD